MELFFQFFLLFVGLGLLWKVGELAVENAIGFSDIFRVTRFAIGFFIFAISTGLPEISSAIVSTLKGIPELSAGDLMGSTLVNLSLILGLVVLISKEIEVGSSLRKKLLWTSVLILIIFATLSFVSDYKTYKGVLLILIYFASFFLFQTKKQKTEAKKQIQKIQKRVQTLEKKVLISPKIDILGKLFGSLILLVVSSWITIHAAAKIAEILQIGLPIIGASLVAIGTGLPEISLEIHAVSRKEYSLALGDIFGSSLLNVSFILGMLILMNPKVDLSIAKAIFPFVIVVLGLALLRIYFQKPFCRLDGWIFMIAFGLYLIALALAQNGLLAW